MMKVKFGDVVNRVNIKVDRHHTDRIYYVGGEHIESNELMIHDKGLIKGSTIGYKFHFGFNPRHILFMSRNPHLRKCSMVNFSGVCSDSTYVIETKDDSVLLQDYLLFEMQSDRFWKWAEEHKSGGVNYLINYATLSSYEFFLPSLSVQRELSKKLWAAYRLKESYKKLLLATRDMVKSQFIEMFAFQDLSLRNPSDDFGKKCYDDTSSATKVPAGDYQNKGRYAIFDQSQNCYIAGYTDSIEGVCNNYPAVLFGDHSRVIKYINQPFYIGADGVKIIRPKEDDLLPEFLYYDLLYHNIPNTGYNRHFKYVKMFKLTEASIDEQKEFLKIAHQADKSEFELKKSIEAIDAVIKSLINS